MGCYDWNYYNSVVGVTTKAELANSDAFSTGVSHIALAIDQLKIEAVPQTGSEGTAIRLFDGTHIFHTPRWTYKITLSWPEMDDATLSDLKDIVSLAMGTSVTGVTPPGGTISGAVNGEFHIIFDYSQQAVSGTSPYTITCVPDLTSETISAIFEGRIRKRPASLTFHSTSSDASLKSALLT